MTTRDFHVGDAFADDLEVVDVLHGSMSRVLVLKNLDRSEPFSPELLCAKTPRASSADIGYSTNRFRQEADSWIRIGRYYPIVTAHDYREVEGRPYLLMEHVDGGSFRDLRARGFHPGSDQLDQARALAFAFLTAIGMRRFYEVLDLPHGDLRPENVLIGQNGQLSKIADFGIANAFSDSPRAGVDHDVTRYGELLSFLFYSAGRSAGNASRRLRLATPPVVEQLIDECARSREIRDGYAFFDGVADRINDFVLARGGTPLRAPEEYDSEENAKRHNQMENLGRQALDGLSVLHVSVKDHETPAIHLNHAGSLSDLGDQEGAFAKWLKGIDAYRQYDRDSPEFAVGVRVVRQILSRVADPVRRADLRRQAELALSPPSVLESVLEFEDPALLGSAYAFRGLEELDAANRTLIDHMIQNGGVDVVREMLAASNPDGDDREVLLSRAVFGLAPLARQDLPHDDQVALHLVLEDATRLSEEDWARRLRSILLKDRGQLLAEVRRFGEAKDAFDESMKLSEALSAADPEETAYRHDLAVLLERLGDFHITVGENGAAVSAFRESLAIRETLAEQAPDTVERQRDLLVIHGRIHVAASKEGDMDAALAAAHASLAIAERLAEGADDAQAARDLSVSQECLATSYMMRGSFAEAVELLRKAIRIRQDLVERDAAEPARYRDLAVAHLKLSEALWFLEDHELGAFHLRQGALVLQQVREQGVAPALELIGE